MVYTICIGSNECREQNLLLARRRLESFFPNISFSREEETKPLYMCRSALFSNQVARFASDSNADEVFSILKGIEKEAGRTVEEKAKEIIRLDIDLLACDGNIYRMDDWERDYVRHGLQQLEGLEK